MQTRLAPDVKVIKVDDYTVDFVLPLRPPHPAFAMGCLVHHGQEMAPRRTRSSTPTPVAATSPSYASLHENGTGPFIIESHQPGVKTVFKANPNYWGKIEG